MQAMEKIFSVDLRTLALFRVFAGIFIIIDLVTRSFSFTAFHTDQGLLPRYKSLGLLNPWQFSIYLYNGQAFYAALLFIIAAVFGIMLIFGYKTRIATIVSFFLYVSLQNRNLQITQLSDNLLTNLLFWAMFLPLGARFSVDAALNKAEPGHNQYLSVASAAILFQAMFVYFFGALMKQALPWHNGLAVYQILHWESYASPLGAWYRELPLIIPKSTTYFVYYVELLGPFLMFSPVFTVPLRLLVMALYFLLHMGFVFFLPGIGVFPFVSIASILLFTPGCFWDWMSNKITTPERKGIVIYYDRGCPFCYKTCLIFRTFFLLPSTPILPAQDYPETYEIMQEYNSWVVYDHKGGHYVRWEAVVFVLKNSFLFRPLSFIFLTERMKKIGDRLYETIAVNRDRLGRLFHSLLPLHSTDIAKRSRAAALLVICLFSVDLWFNMASVGMVKVFPEYMQPVRYLMNIDPWGMFIRMPPEPANWYVMEGIRRDGRIVDVYNNTENPPSYDAPRSIFYTYKDYRWRKYLQHVQWKWKNKDDFGRYFCSAWNEGRPPEDQIRQLKVYVNGKAYMPNIDKFNGGAEKFSYGKNLELYYDCEKGWVL